MKSRGRLSPWITLRTVRPPCSYGISKLTSMPARALPTRMQVPPVLGLRMYFGGAAEDRLAPDEAISIADLSRPLPRPSYLACPPSYCAAAGMPSAIFDMPWDQLREYWKEMIVETAAILVVSEFEHRRAVYIQRSAIFGFPDIVTVELVALGPERSSVAVYSRSRYGGYDFAKTASASNDG